MKSILVLLFLLLATDQSYSRENSKTINALLLFSWHKNLPWQRSLEEGLANRFEKNEISAQIYTEYVDGQRFPLSKTFNTLCQLLEQKYQDKELNLIISEGFSAAKVLQRIKKKFPDAQVIELNNYSSSKQSTKSHRIYAPVDFHHSIQTMMNLYNPKQLVIIGDSGNPHEKKRFKLFKKVLAEHWPKIPARFLMNMSIENLIKKTKDLPKKTAIFYLLIFRKHKNQLLSPYKNIEPIAKSSNAPIFSHWGALMGSGILGGYLLSPYKIGEQIGGIISQLSEGHTLAKNITLKPDEVINYQFDWNQLQRWGIEQFSLPPNSKILYKKPGLLETYPREMGFIISLIVILMFLVLALIVQVQRRKKLSKQLQVSQNYLHSIFNSSPDPIIVFDLAGKAKYMNSKFDENLQWPIEKLQNWRYPFAQKKDQHKIAKLVRLVISTSKNQRIQITGTSPKGTPAELIISIASINNNRNRCIGLILVLTDISKQKNMELQLQQTQRVESLGRLAGGIAHDFNNILSAIIGNAEYAQAISDKEDKHFNNLSKILQGSLRAKDIIKQILTFSRKEKMQLTEIDLAKVLAETIQMISEIIPATLELEVNLIENVPAIEADITSLNQVIINLINNAVDSIESAHGQVSISLEKYSFSKEEAENTPEISLNRDYLKLTITDSGCGIPEEHLEKIFDPYFTTKQPEKGTGLGLSIVHTIIKNFDGFIRVHSTPNIGTTMELFFPTIEGWPKRSQQEENQYHIIPKTILLIDDEEDILEINKMGLEMHGHNVITINNPLAAIDFLKETDQEFDLIISDQSMPHMTGVDLATHIHQMLPTTPILLCSGHAITLTLEEIDSTGIASCLAKPMTLDELLQEISAVTTD